VDDDLLVIENSWPGTTIDGDPRIVPGMLSVSPAAGGEFLLDLSVGPPEAHREPCWIRGRNESGGTSSGVVRSGHRA
jgi:hypothetical protein